MSRIAYLLHPLLVFGLVLAALMSGDGGKSERLQAGLFAGIWAHILVSFYIGRFDRLRTQTFLLLMLAMLAGQIYSFARFVLPWGQMAFLLASHLPQGLARWLAPAFEARTGGQLVWSSILFVLLAIDVMVLQRKAAGLSRIVAIGMAALTGVIIMRSVPNLEAASLPSLQQFDVIPHWSLLPGYSILRAVPDKTLGVAALAAAGATPLIIPWLQAERIRLSRTGWLWLLNSLALAATCITLGYLGARPPDDATIRASQIATGVYFLLFLVVPQLMKMTSNGMSKHVPQS